MNKNLLIILFFTIQLSVCFGQSSDFAYKRKLAPVQKEEWYAITLPVDVFKKLQPGYPDVRLYQFNGKDTTEIPYLIKVKNDEVSEGVISLPVLNKSTKDKSLYLTFQLNRDLSVNYLDLNFEEKNFNGHVRLEGSNDQKEWFELVNSQRILSIQNQDIDFKASTLNFPLTNYKFLRTSISSDKKLTFEDATFRTKEVKVGSFTEIKSSQSITQDKKSKQTIAEINLNEFQPISRLSVKVNQSGDYYRSFALESLRDSIQSPNKKWQYNYEPVFNGYLTSIEPNNFEFNVISAKKLKLTIYNADNSPLKIEGISASGPQVQLIAKLSTGDNYLFYGNSRAYAPSYDLVHFEDQIPDSLTSVSLDKEEKLIPEKAKVSPLLENKLWLWIAMGAIIALLGFATIRMMGKK